MEGIFAWIQKLLEEGWDYIKIFPIINKYEEGVLLRLGRPLKNGKSILKPGPHIKFPIIDYVHTAYVTADTMEIRPVNITTLDGKTSTDGLVVEYEVEDIYKYLIETNDPKSNMHDICRGILSSILEDLNWEDIRKKTTINAITRRIKEKCKEMGVRVKEVYFSDKCLTKAIKIFSEDKII